MVLSWGFSWYAIKLQLGDIPIEASIAWRFLFASSILFLLLRLSGKLTSVTYRVHFWLVLLGLTLFCLNFLAVYAATNYIASGLVSVFFAFAAIFGSLNAWLFLSIRPTSNVFIGSVIGVAGLAVFTFVDVTLTANTGAVVGMTLAAAGAYSFSLGGIVSTRLRKDIDIGSSTAWAMLYGGVMMSAFCIMKYGSVPIGVSPEYLWSMLYLVVVASVIGFLSYVTVVNQLGPGKAAFVTVLFPVVAMTTSTLLEDIHWTVEKVIGAALILAGLIQSLRSKPHQER